MQETLDKFKKDLEKGRELEPIDLDVRLTHYCIMNDKKKKTKEEVKELYQQIMTNIDGV